MSLLSELRRRSIFKVGVTYAVLAWLIIQVANTVFDNLALPDWSPTLVTVLLIAGFPVALLLAWAYEMTPEGIKATGQRPIRESLAKIRGERVNFWMTSALAIAVAFMAVDNYWFRSQGQGDQQPAVTLTRAQPERFFIDAPSGSEFPLRQMAPHPALTADGQYVAFTAPPRSGDPNRSSGDALEVLWLQRIGDLEARPLTGTEGASFPFWSPDRRYIAYGRGATLERFSVNGAASQSITGTEGYIGGSWGAQGTIIYGSRTGLVSVSSDGGAISQVTRIAADEAQFSHRYPEFFPDGRSFIYQIVHPDPERDGLYIASLDDPPEKRQRLTASASNGKLATGPDGLTYLFYVQNYTLLAQAFNSDQPDLSGDVRTVAGPIEPGAGGRLAPFSVSGRDLIYRPRYRPSTQLRRFSRDGAPGETIDLDGAILNYPSLSRDGSKLAASRTGDTSQSIWWFDLDRGFNERLTEESDINAMPAWGNEGDRVFYTRLRLGGSYDIYAQRLSAEGAEIPISTMPMTKYLRDVTRDGRYVIFQAGTRDIWAALVDGSGSEFPVLQSDSIENHARVSPNGEWIAYSSIDPGSESEIYVTSFPAPGARPQRVSTDGGADPQWRADGRELYYVASNNMLMSVPVTPGETIGIGTPEPMFRINPEPWSLRFGSVYSPAPDGQSFIVSEMVGNNAVQLMMVRNWGFEQ